MSAIHHFPNFTTKLPYLQCFRRTTIISRKFTICNLTNRKNLVKNQLSRKSKAIVLASMDLSTTAKTNSSMDFDEEYASHGKLLQDFYDIPSIDKAWLSQSLLSNSLQFMVCFNQTNLPSNKKRSFVLSGLLADKADPLSCQWSPFPIELSDVSLVVPSPSGKNVLIVRNGDSKDTTSPIKLEIWGPAQLQNEILIARSVHGPVYTDGWFQGVSWSYDENDIAYIAEEASSNQQSFTSSGYKSGSSSDKEPGSWNLQGDFMDDWGETYSGKRRPVLFVVNIKSGTVQAVEGIPKDLSVGQVVWAPRTSEGSINHLIFVGWPSDSCTSRKLGMRYCYNRYCAIYAVSTAVSKWDSSEDVKEAKVLTRNTSSAFLPRFSPDGKLLVFLSASSSVETGVHCSTNSLHTILWPSDGFALSEPTVNTTIPVVMCPERNLFPGLYCASLLSCPWLSDCHTMILSSIWGSTQVLLAIDTISGKVSRITPCNTNSSWNVLAVHKDTILAVCSSPADPGTLKYGQLIDCKGDNEKNMEWKWTDLPVPPVDYMEEVRTTLSSISTTILKVPVKHPELVPTEGGKKPFEVVFVTTKAKEDATNPLIVILHGGPHSTSLTSFSKSSAFLSSLGFNLLYVNYRGSLGFGEEALQTLPGNVGIQDVLDVINAVDFVIDKGFARPAKIGVLGGSHGGFLTTHLIGQVPDKFAAAVSRNPVCNLALMVGTTDIPDWCYVEVYGKNGKDCFSEVTSVKDLKTFYEMSPISHVSKVKVPVLMLLGAQDLRVPVSNGLQYARCLKESGVEVKLIVFPNDVHSIDRPQSDFESSLNIGAWFKRFLQ